MEPTNTSKTGTTWTNGEVSFLKKHYAYKPNGWIGFRVRRTSNAVQKKARALGLKKADSFLKATRGGKRL